MTHSFEYESCRTSQDVSASLLLLHLQMHEWVMPHTHQRVVRHKQTRHVTHLRIFALLATPNFVTACTRTYVSCDAHMTESCHTHPRISASVSCYIAREETSDSFGAFTHEWVSYNTYEPVMSRNRGYQGTLLGWRPPTFTHAWMSHVAHIWVSYVTHPRTSSRLARVCVCVCACICICMSVSVSVMLSTIWLHAIHVQGGQDS